MSDETTASRDPDRDLEYAGIVIYGKPGCCLCDDAKPIVQALGAEYGLPVYHVNILNDAPLYAAYRYRIPVVRYADLLLDEGRVSEVTLRAGLQRAPAPAPVAPRHVPNR